jgi:addiction module HigA family antidote
MAVKRLVPIHPGEILEEEFMRPLGLSANGLAKALDVPVTRVSEIVRGRRGVTADTALRLARLLGTSAELWMGLQAEHDLRVASRDTGDEIERRVSRLRVSGDRYDSSGTATGGSEVRDVRAGYGADSEWRTRDRRRDRRSKKRPD